MRGILGGTHGAPNTHYSLAFFQMKNYLLFTFLLLITVILNTSAQTLLKLGVGQNFLNIYLLGGISAYGLSTIFYLFCPRQI